MSLYPVPDSERPDIDPSELRHCWECGAYVAPEQRRHTLKAYRGVICSRCEPWVRSVLKGKEA